eukprot:COSAG02_NODE_30508_length_549_cov_1.915556_1_plen_92_part_00
MATVAKAAGDERQHLTKLHRQGSMRSLLNKNRPKLFGNETRVHKRVRTACYIHAVLPGDVKIGRAIVLTHVVLNTKKSSRGYSEYRVLLSS